ncbi:hypothetical protein CWE12_07250 [Aliidiomarina sedimenti]|uniref:Lipoprotein n=1 Tax=Aliidiomarina sedimenti TaxID=1933879 RepID=A0ABY0BYK4_9GAMM|nr:hypothetical protein [Aliidiomarina sedimenti]RUO29761.1 hypothetical protein CWE12_07250 [Aliidiomarina sedimenti]
MKLIILFLALGLTGCTTQAWYEEVRSRQLQECRNGTIEDYDECRQRVDKSYPQYERERQEVMGKK